MSTQPAAPTAAATPAMLSGLLKTAATDPKLKGLISHVSDPTLSIATIDQARPWAIGALANHTPLLVVTATGREAEDLTAELKALWGDQVAWFPAWETLPHERLSPAADVAGDRVIHRRTATAIWHVRQLHAGTLRQ